jgi:hypothetical protein
MEKLRLTRVWVCLVGIAGIPTPAFAQIYETIGTRAQGMGGAFTAVSDDATATWWNPAGIAVTYFSTVIDRSEVTEPAEAPGSGPAWRSRTQTYATAFPALGLSYYRLRISEIEPLLTTADGQPGRQDGGGAGTSLRSLVTHQFGATVGQSVGNHLVIASTMRLVRAGVANGSVSSGGFDAADDLDVPLETSGDLDIGALAMAGPVRIGVSVKHVNEPDFGDDADRFVMKRQARVGFAWVAGQARSPVTLTAAADADLTKTPTIFGDARHVAAGAEVLLRGQQLAVRAGVSANTVGDLTSSTSAGVSIGVSRGLYLDGAATFGSDRSRKGWAIGLRLTI